MPTRKEVLEMLSRGEIDVTRATELLNQPPDPEPVPQEAAPEAAPVPRTPAQELARSKRRWLHIHVSDLETGKNRVRVNVPLGLVNFGLKVGARFTNEVDNDMIDDVLDALHDEELTGTLVEVEDVDDNERVHIFVD
jgi:hypothetical protein